MTSPMVMLSSSGRFGTNVQRTLAGMPLVSEVGVLAALPMLSYDNGGGISDCAWKVYSGDKPVELGLAGFSEASSDLGKMTAPQVARFFSRVRLDRILVNKTTMPAKRTRTAMTTPAIPPDESPLVAAVGALPLLVSVACAALVLLVG